MPERWTSGWANAVALGALSVLAACSEAHVPDGADTLPLQGGAPADAGGAGGLGSTNAGASAEASSGAPGSGPPPLAASPGAVTAAALGIPIPARGQVLNAQALAAQLLAYDPGSLLRCAVAEDTRYAETIDALGGVTWNYSVGVLEDQSKPRYLAGVQRPLPPVFGAASTGEAASPAPVEIAKADIVAVTETAALFYSQAHGLMIVNVGGEKPVFHCAAQLPGSVGRFYFYDGHLVAMTKSRDARAHLLHFTVKDTELAFVEDVDLGAVNVLDSRRFNGKLVLYTTFTPEAASTTQPVTSSSSSGVSPIAPTDPATTTRPVAPARQHRALRVYEIADTLKPELYDTLMDTSVPETALVQQGIDPALPIGTEISTSQSFGGSMWASDRYFVVTEQITKTLLSGFRTQTYSVCTKSHNVELQYQYCWTEYEERPNPDYVPPDNSGGDRACHGLTLSECLREVARVSNRTIQVPVGRKCEQRVLTNKICDAFEQRTGTTYPVFESQVTTRLYIYEYTETGFVRVDSQVHEVDDAGLVAADPDAPVDVVTTSSETFDLAVPGVVQTLYFQNGYLYVISRGVLQVYAMGGSSIVRTSTLQVVNETLQSSLFASDRLILSDFGLRGGDHSTLRVLNLTNPAFPTQDGATHSLPGGHRSILLAEAGIFTIGTVQQFEGRAVNALKLGLFTDPYAEETAYLVLATDLESARFGEEEAQVFNRASQRLLVPYAGRDQTGALTRVGVSRVLPGSIESEGAVVLPELAERVRPLLRAEESYLAFARNSIEWLTPNGKEWQREPVLEYYEPFSLYRRDQAEELVELQRLGNRCRLYFSSRDDLNQRAAEGAYSDAYPCNGGSPTAYDRRFLHESDRGLEFSDDHTVRELSEAEIQETRALIAARPYCLLTLDYVDNPYALPKDLPSPEEFTCMSPEEYNELVTRLSTTTP